MPFRPCSLKPTLKIQFLFVYLLLAFVSITTETVLAQDAGALQNALTFENNFFVTGDYAVGGVGLIGQANKIYPGYAVGTISIGADGNPGVKGLNNSVPKGAEIVAGLVYWQTVEQIGGATGQNGFFRPVFSGGPATGYQMQGTALKNPNGTVYWNGTGCTTGSSTPKQLITYVAVVTPYLRQDGSGNVLAGNLNAPQNYEVKLPSQSNGAPLTLGATLVLIYRVMSPNFPLNSIIIYDGTYSPSSSLLTAANTIQGFYQADGKKSKLTYIVGNGQKNNSETVYLNNSPLPSLYTNQPPFPGNYSGGEWDNVTWTFPNAAGLNPVGAGSPDPPQSWPSQRASTSVTSDKAECVTPAAIIFSTTVADPANDGLLPVWKNSNGYCDAASITNGTPGACTVGDAYSGWVSLGDPDPNNQPKVSQKDVFVQLDYMVNSAGSPLLNQTNVNAALARVKNAFLGYAENTGTNNSHNVHLHVSFGNASQNYSGAITQQTCTDFSSVPGLCSFPSPQGDPGGYVGWKGNFTDIKNQLVSNNPNDNCTTSPLPARCQPRFQHGRKDSYHYVMLGRAPGLTEWALSGGSLSSVQQTGNSVTFTTSTPHGPLNAIGIVYPTKDGGLTTLDVNGLPTGFAPPRDPCTQGYGRVTIVGAITNPSLNGTYCIQSSDDTTFTINVGGTARNASYMLATDPDLEVAPGYVTTTSGISDEGGEDSLITLASWGPRATEKVIRGTIMHETGHSNALTHGGFFFAAPAQGDYTPAIENNCKANFQSVMSYTRQFDLLQYRTGWDASNNPILTDVVDYSEDSLDDLTKSTAGVPNVFSSNPLYFYTTWYRPTSEVGGTGSLLHCDGTPITDGAQYSLLTGPAIQPSTGQCPLCNPPLNWLAGEDINFDGTMPFQGVPGFYTETLKGYKDWDLIHINFDQVGATGSLSSNGGGLAGRGGGLAGRGGTAVQGGGLAGRGGGLAGRGGGLAGRGGGLAGRGSAEPSLYSGDSAVHPPTQLFATEDASPRHINLTWTKPTGLTVADRYNIYRNGTPVTASVSSTGPVTCNDTQCTYTDTTASCNPTGYTYAVSALQAPNTNNESTKSNSVSIGSDGVLTGCYVISNFSAPASAVQGSTVAVTWTLKDDFNTINAPVTRSAANTLVAIGPIPGNCAASGRTILVADGTPTNAGTVDNGSVDALTNNANNFTFTWNRTDAFCAGQYNFELDLDHINGAPAQTQKAPNALQLSIDINDTDSTPHITTLAVPDGTVGVSYTNPLSEDGGTAPFTWSISSGSTPPGITLSASGVLSGTPTVPPPGAFNFTAQVFNFTVQVKDSASPQNVGTQALTLRVIAPVSFNATTYNTGMSPKAVISADFNGDGQPDLATANSTGNTVSILLGIGNGTFAAAPSSPLAAGTNPDALAAGDLDGDGNADLVVANAGDNAVVIFLGIGNGTFQSGGTYSVGTYPSSVATGDFNGDGVPDVAVANQNDHTISVLIGMGNGTFSQPNPAYTAGTMDVATVVIGDFNKDGKLDLAVTNPSSDTVSILKGNGDGTFQAPVALTTGAAGDHPAAVTAFDFNGDGNLDLAVTNLNAKVVAILLGNGDGTFQPRMTFPATNGAQIGPSAMTIGDFNGDGRVDLAIATQGDNTASILIGNGDGKFQSPLEFPPGNLAVGVATGDFNGDGRLDLAVANMTDSTVSVLLHLPQPPTNVVTTGVTTTQVTLAWTASLSTGVSGYNVYQATTSGGQYLKLNGAPVSGNAYTDMTVTSSTTYYYIVRAVDANNLESVKSNEVSAMP